MIKTKITAGLISLLMTSSLALAEVPQSYSAEEITTSYVGEVLNEVIGFDYDDEEGVLHTIHCKAYEVVPNDSPSRISRIMCREYGVEETEKYWPVFCYMNRYPKMIHPGDIVIYPETIEETIELYDFLERTNWIHDYVVANDVYNERQRTTGDNSRGHSTRKTRIKGAFMTNWTIASVLDEIYGEGTSENENFVNAYLSAVNMNDYDERLESGINERLNNEEVSMLTDWIPTREDLTEYGYNPKTK